MAIGNLRPRDDLDPFPNQRVSSSSSNNNNSSFNRSEWTLLGVARLVECRAEEEEVVVLCLKASPFATKGPPDTKLGHKPTPIISSRYI